MVTLKPRETTASVEKFLNSIVDETRRNDAFTLLALMKQATGEEAKMWGSAIIGFGSRKLVYESGVKVLKKLVEQSVQRVKKMS